ncbi:peptidoglycan-binding protein [Psychromarinibacter halotolerans]|uniref:Peptidoglycan-binding protein n=1 Tax=Psychromarinibacter halotolerans TaxID=1775175 RepID=A0ABV7GYE2_9RHOB|nr:peptidoglycan-binding protein [Psychromarinibacter halotolerans]MDF0598453.1 peptidoglycan-binding protein [Psychromarinibacter halotolerans]
MTGYNYDARDLQRRLAALGLYSGEIDGVVGPKTEAAIVAFKRGRGLRPRPYIGPLTWNALIGMTTSTSGRSDAAYQPPWLNELGKVIGLHEVRDNGALTAWLRSDGRTLGDPAALPWCGDAAETAMLRALPNEPVVPSTNDNPYWARHWQGFGKPCGRVLGAAVPMSRDGGGHIAFLIGVSLDGQAIRCRGGNQSNMISDAWFDADRALTYRWPVSYPESMQRPAPIMDAAGAILSANEG